MLVTVHYTTQLKSALGIAYEQLALDEGATLSTLLQRLADTHGATFTDLTLSDQQRLLPSIIVSIDDCQITPNQDVQLTDGNQVMFLSAISGG